jgi:chitodextrinase
VKTENRETKIENRYSRSARRPVRLFPSADLPFFDFRFSIIVFAAVLLEISCGVPAEPQPRHPAIPEAVTDLTVRQRGDGGLLTFTAPARNLDGEKLANPPNMEILRGFAPPAAQSPASGSLHVVYTLPGQLLDNYRVGERIEFQDPIAPEEIARHAGERVFYIVRGRVSKRAASEDSNAASFVAHPVPAPIEDVRATVIEAGVQLSWEPPATVSGGAPLTAVGGYRIYRAEAPSGTAQGAERQPPALAGVSPSPNYLDAQIEWGKTYVYTVRSVAQYVGEAIESGESRSVQVTPKDIFPPAAPLELAGVFVPATGASPAAVELSWAISPEPDAAGYYVYRAGEGEEKAQRVTPTLLPTPAFRDTSVTPGATYRYEVTAVDRSGNESQPSKPMVMKIPGAGD